MIERETVRDDIGVVGERVIGIKFHRFDPSYTASGNCVVCGEPKTAVGHDPAALARTNLVAANKARIAGAHVKHEVKAGELDILDALNDDRAGSLDVVALLAAQRGWSITTARGVVRDIGISELKKVKDLRLWQRDALVSTLTSWRTAA